MKKFYNIFLTLVTLLTIGVGQLWADNSVTIYIAINASTMKSGNNCYTLKVNANIGDNNTWRQVDAVQDKAKTTNGKLYFSATFSEKYGGVDALQIQLYNGSSWVAQRQPYSSWTTSSTFSGKMYDYDNQSWGANPSSFDASYYVYFVNTSSWSTPKAYAFSGCDENSSWSGTAMTNTGKTYNGKTIYQIQYTRRYDNIIFSNNGASQTTDLTLGTTNAGKMYDNGTWRTYNYDVTITFNMKGHGTAPSNITLLKGGTASAPSDPSEAGYTFGGWYTNSACTSAWSWSSTVTDNKTLYAKWTPKSCSITLDYQTDADGYASSGAISNAGSLTATYGSAMTTLTGTMPSAKSGYVFMGFYTGTNGTGTKYYNASGTSARNWAENTTSTTTLYAYYQKCALVITLSPSTVAAGETVTATASVSPVPSGSYKICSWTILHNNGTPLDPQPSLTNVTNGVSFTAPSTGTAYKVQAKLYLGTTTCGGGTLWDTKEETFYIASDHTINVQYKCGDYEIATSTTTVGKPLEFTTVTAPNITGYAFSEWKLADGMTLKDGDAATDATIHFKAIMDGNLIAKYTKKNVIYFNNTLGWSDVYVYFYNTDEYWSNTYGSGARQSQTFNGDHKPYWEQEHGHMTHIDGTNIWYFDYTEAGYDIHRDNVVFTEGNQHNNQWFYQTKAVRRGDHNAALPMYVPINTKTQTINETDYYNNGYWMNYPENTGYTLMIYDRVDEVGAILVNEIPFEFTPDKTMPMSVTAELSEKHTYGFKIKRADDAWFGNTGTMKNGNSGDTGQTLWEFRQKNADLSDKPKCGLLTTAAGNYTFKLNYGEKSGVYDYFVGVHYPAETGDFRIVYNDVAEWSLGSTHSEDNWKHPSRLIPHEGGAVDTISFFVTYGKSPRIKIQKITGINSTTGAVTWGDVGTWRTSETSTVTKSGVYNFRIVQNAAGTAISTIENIGEYEGDYYIRCGALNSKWDYYRTDRDHKMTYSAFSESDENVGGEKFSHYKAKWCPRGTNIMFCIANDYSPCISDTLITDVPNNFNNVYVNDAGGRADGELKAESYDGNGVITSSETEDKYSANVRFMWNWKTNKISRAYVASSTNTTKRFLVLQASSNYMKDHNNVAFSASNPGSNATLLDDDQNWIYEVMVKVIPTARVRLYACYTNTEPFSAQYFRGTYGASYTTANTIQLLGGSGSTPYTMRVIYDFKTNRLITAWMPDGVAVNGQPLKIEADVMIIRDHQEAADAITFTNTSKSLSEVKTVYGTMRFNRWTLNNRYRSSDTSNPSFTPSETETDFTKEHCNTTEAISQYHAPLPLAKQKSTYERGTYFISFPFDVALNEVFGFGEYGTHWIISEYNGKRRAKYGYFYDQCWDWDCTNWDYVWDRSDYKLKAYQGYLLQLDLDLMQYDDTSKFWINQIHQVELFFPSSSTVSSIGSTNKTMDALSDADYLCTINRNTDGTHPDSDRRVKDSYWRCIGVPSYAEYGTALKTGETTISWQTNYTWRADFKNFPFLYEWDVTDNSLTPMATSSYRFKPMHAYLVQNGNAITWTAVNASPSPIVARRAKQVDENTEYTWNLTLKTANDSSITFIRMTDDEQVTDTFDFGQDLIKEFRDGYLLDEHGEWIITGYDTNNEPIYKQGTIHSDIYSFIGYERVAANSLPISANTTTIPIGVRTKEAGDFTISLPDGTNGIGITLVDKEANTRTNLALGDYTVALGQGQFDNRFELEISPIQNAPTSMENTENENQKQNIRKVLIDGILYIVRDDKIYDSRGTRIQ